MSVLLEAEFAQRSASEPCRDLCRLIRLSHRAVTGVEIRVDAVAADSTTPETARMRPTLADSVAGRWSFRHCCAPYRPCLKPTASGLMTDSLRCVADVVPLVGGAGGRHNRWIRSDYWIPEVRPAFAGNVTSGVSCTGVFPPDSETWRHRSLRSRDACPDRRSRCSRPDLFAVNVLASPRTPHVSIATRAFPTFLPISAVRRSAPA